jgi:uncharacterized protein
MNRYGDIAFSPEAQQHQRRHGSLEHYSAGTAGPAPDGLGEAETQFLRERDSFYIASVGSNGWPYVQHRGGPAGFVHVLDATHIGWADRLGNRQYVSAGNLDHDPRVSIIAVDYPNRQRLKLYGRARYETEPDESLRSQFARDGRADAIVIVEVAAFDWNCPKHITPRYTEAQVRTITDPLRERVQALEVELAALRSSTVA